MRFVVCMLSIVSAVVLHVPSQKPVAMSSKLRIPLVSYIKGMSDVLEAASLGEASCRNEGDPNRVLLVRLIVKLGEEYRDALVPSKEVELGAECMQWGWAGDHPCLVPQGD
jgi:hypothetical protein